MGSREATSCSWRVREDTFEILEMGLKEGSVMQGREELVTWGLQCCQAFLWLGQ